MCKVYVGTYAKYNNGDLTGAWLDLEDYSDFDEFSAACHELHADEQDPEIMFQDFEGFPKSFYGESALDPAIWDWIALDDDDRNMLAAYQDGVDPDGDIEAARDAFQGTAQSTLDYVYGYVDDSGMLDSMPENLRIYFDYEAFARDLFINSFTFVEYEGTGYVFSTY